MLQASAEFRSKCAAYYKHGYKDWVILSAIMNCMMNWKLIEQGTEIRPKNNPGENDKILSTMREEMFKAFDKLQGVKYPPQRFLGSDMEVQLKMHGLTALKTYGFTPRRIDFKPETIEKFLHERMRHFELDIPHKFLFGEPPGDWPEVGSWQDEKE